MADVLPSPREDPLPLEGGQGRIGVGRPRQRRGHEDSLRGGAKPFYNAKQSNPSTEGHRQAEVGRSRTATRTERRLDVVRPASPRPWPQSSPPFRRSSPPRSSSRLPRPPRQSPIHRFRPRLFYPPPPGPSSTPSLPSRGRPSRRPITTSSKSPPTRASTHPFSATGPMTSRPRTRARRC